MSYAPQTCQCTLLNCGCVRCTYESLSRPKAKKTPQLWTWCVQYLSEHLKTPSYHLRKKYRLVEFFSVKRGDIDFIYTKGRLPSHIFCGLTHTQFTMGKGNSKLKGDTLDKLTADTYCKYEVTFTSLSIYVRIMVVLDAFCMYFTFIVSLLNLLKLETQ